MSDTTDSGALTHWGGSPCATCIDAAPILDRDQRWISNLRALLQVPIPLRHCPFQNLAEQHGEVICSVHLGLMQGALTAMRAPVTVDRLDPFVEPDLCVAHLAPAPTRDRASS
jgi:hypothetical protein